MVENGQICPSPHHISQLENYSYRDLPTIGRLKAYLGLANYLAKFLHHSTEVFNDLRKASTGDIAEKINWTVELVDSFNKSKKALSELAKIYPFDPNLDTIVIMDTSILATGAILYQKGVRNRRIIGFFSKKRADLQRKNYVGSCILELSGAAAAVNYWPVYLAKLQI